MLASEFCTNKLSIWHICTLFLIFPLLCVQTSSAPFSSISYRFSSIPYMCVMAFSHYSFEINLYQTDLSRPGNNGTVATECSAAGWEAFAELWAQTLYTHNTQSGDTDTLTWDHRTTREEMRKTTLFILRWPSHSQRQPPHIKMELLSQLTGGAVFSWILDSVVLFLLNLLVPRKLKDRGKRKWGCIENAMQLQVMHK